MPTPSNEASYNGRAARDNGLRQFANGLVDFAYTAALPALSLVALAIAGYAFTRSFAEGARSVIFYVIPVMWGAYALAVNDGKKNVFSHKAQTFVLGLAVVGALIVCSVMFLKAPISIANLALGGMAAFFFLMWTSDRSTPYQRRPSQAAKTWMLALLVMMTIIAVFAAIAL